MFYFETRPILNFFAFILIATDISHGYIIRYFLVLALRTVIQNLWAMLAASPPISFGSYLYVLDNLSISSIKFLGITWNSLEITWISLKQFIFTRNKFSEDSKILSLENSESIRLYSTTMEGYGQGHPFSLRRVFFLMSKPFGKIQRERKKNNRMCERENFLEDREEWRKKFRIETEKKGRCSVNRYTLIKIVVYDQFIIPNFFIQMALHLHQIEIILLSIVADDRMNGH